MLSKPLSSKDLKLFLWGNSNISLIISSYQLSRVSHFATPLLVGYCMLAIESFMSLTFLLPISVSISDTYLTLFSDLQNEFFILANLISKIFIAPFLNVQGPPNNTLLFPPQRNAIIPNLLKIQTGIVKIFFSIKAQRVQKLFLRVERNNRCLWPKVQKQATVSSSTYFPVSSKFNFYLLYL